VTESEEIAAWIKEVQNRKPQEEAKPVPIFNEALTKAVKKIAQRAGKALVQFPYPKELSEVQLIIQQELVKVLANTEFVTKPREVVKLQWWPPTHPSHKANEKQPQGVVFGSIWVKDRGMVDLTPGDWITYDDKMQATKITPD
jgi:hypothetical protein